MVRHARTSLHMEATIHAVAALSKPPLNGRKNPDYVCTDMGQPIGRPTLKGKNNQVDVKVNDT
jgi:hypothetical protein